ncbi:cystathionine beta-lyase [Mycoavidus sp. B2-EB]|uniref:cystathionine beta-lyase n=1 Tax=Mycoavidus sp. B2-EB TaxID=2651972 RepID=UPI0016275E5B|nr:cystathionine beta-lyase [Mycoavidus sp. B2-EB]BBO59964.1 cystathionine beta-lyase [Mycoavidus sp. B2-EB]
MDTHLQTELVHHAQANLTAGWAAISAPVTRASTVIFPNLATLRALDWRHDAQWRYGLHATPISHALAQQLARLEGATHALLQPSGLAAIVNVYQGLLQQGDDVLIPDNAYTPNRDYGAWLARFGISARYYDPLMGAEIAQLIQANTRLIWLEAPGSVTMEVPDVRGITQVARARGIYTALDNTWSAGLAFKPFEHGCDISVQALTKYQSGGSDVLMGATLTTDTELYLKLKQARMQLGFGVSADDCALVLRGLPSMTVRYAAHEQSALALARWLQTRPEVVAVLHPALPDCPGHASWKRDFSGSGGLFSVVFDEKYTPVQIDRFVEGLQFFKLGFSWGGALSLALPYDVAPLRTVTRWPHRGGLVRFFIGLEDERDLRADLERSMSTHLLG